MAGTIDPAAYKDVMLVLATAAIVVPVVQRFKISPVLGFLMMGALLGPFGLGALAGAYPGMSWITVGNKDSLHTLAELGVVFLLFLIGLELSIKRLVTMRRLVFGLGGLQVIVSALVLGFVAYGLGLGAGPATIVGLSLALSSTAIVVEELSQQNRLRTATGRSSFAILLFQDLAVVPLILLVTILQPGQEGSASSAVMLAFAQATIAVGLIVAIGSILLRPLFRSVAASGNTELFVAATLLVAVGSGVVTALAGLSMALGAFIAGLLLSETEFRRAIEATIDPFKGLLLGVFFFTVGMSLDLGALVSNPWPVLAGVSGLIAIKATITMALARGFGLPWAVSFKTGLLIGPGGEFAFIVLGMAVTSGLLDPAAGAYALTVTSVSMVMIPLLDSAGQVMVRHFEERSRNPPGHGLDAALALMPSSEMHAKAIVVGYGRVGELVAEMLSRHGIEHVITERAPQLVRQARLDGKPVYFGDGKNTQFLARCGLADAKAVIITMHMWSEVDDLVAAIRAEWPKLVIVARARDAGHARRLYELGATDAVPETIEASLQLSEAALVGLGVPTGPVIASIHEKRDEFRHELQAAVNKIGRPESRGLRAKSSPDKVKS
ncbi:MAG: cation:proton antiporter [Hyphomicrobium sp.]